MDRGRFDGSKGEPFQRTMPPTCLYTRYTCHYSIPPAWLAVVRPLRYGYRREIRRGLIIVPWTLVCPRNSTNGRTARRETWSRVRLSPVETRDSLETNITR